MITTDLKVIDVTVDKQHIAEMPKVVFPGRIEVVQSEREMLKAIEYLRKQPVVGLDTETRPCFSKDRSHKVSLLQVSSDNICFLFRLNLIGLPAELISFLEEDTPIKIGISFHDDVRMLHQRASFEMGKWVELQKMVGLFGIADRSLQKIYANLFHQRISKTQRLSNWEADVLSDGQKQYAAIDAWACIRIYRELMNMRMNHNYVLATETSMLSMIDHVVVDMKTALPKKRRYRSK